MKSKNLRHLSFWFALALTFALVAACTSVPPAANTSDAIDDDVEADLEITATPMEAVPEITGTPGADDDAFTDPEAPTNTVLMTDDMEMTDTEEMTDGMEMTDSVGTEANEVTSAPDVTNATTLTEVTPITEETELTELEEAEGAILTDTDSMTDSDMMTDTGMVEGATAVAQIDELDGSGVSGTVTFTQETDGLMVMVSLDGVDEGLHGFHVHENGSCEAGDSDNDGVDEPGGAAGGHFNPTDAPHGALDDPADERHVGDFGNVEADADGVVDEEFSDDVASLDGENSIVDLAIIVHSGEDDLVTQPGGDSGSRVGCGIIEMQ